MSTVAIIFTAYGVVGVLVLRPLAGHFAWMMHRNLDGYDRGRMQPTGEQWFGAYAGALGLVFFWPVVLSAWALGQFGPKIGDERIAEIERREAAMRQAESEREERLRKAEQEVGLPAWDLHEADR